MEDCDYFRRILIEAEATGKLIHYSGNFFTPPLLHELLDAYIHAGHNKRLTVESAEKLKENLLAILCWCLKKGADPRVKYKGVSLLQRSEDSGAVEFHKLLFVLAERRPSAPKSIKKRPVPLCQWSLKSSSANDVRGPSEENFLTRQKSWPLPPESKQDRRLKKN